MSARPLKDVVAVRLDGRRVLFGRYPADVAERTAASLRRMQLGAEVVDAHDESAIPGTAVDDVGAVS